MVSGSEDHWIQPSFGKAVFTREGGEDEEMDTITSNTIRNISPLLNDYLDTGGVKTVCNAHYDAEQKMLLDWERLQYRSYIGR